MAKSLPLPAIDRLHELLKVVPILESQFGVQSGLVWRVDRGGHKAGSVAGTLGRYRDNRRLDWKVCVDRKRYAVSRIVYFMVNNVDPDEFEIDHIDRNTLNNNESNLRLAASLIQMHNQGMRVNNTSGVMGVSWHKDYKKWWTALTYKGVLVVNDFMGCKIEAARVRNDKIIELGLDKLGKPLNDLEAIVCTCAECSNK